MFYSLCNRPRPIVHGMPQIFTEMWLNFDQQVQIIIASPGCSENYCDVLQMNCVERATTCKASAKERPCLREQAKTLQMIYEKEIRGVNMLNLNSRAPKGNLMNTKILNHQHLANA